MGGGGGGFDADALRDELRAMMLPGQSLQLSVQRLSVMEDPALAVAFPPRFARQPPPRWVQGVRWRQGGRLYSSPHATHVLLRST